MTRPKLLDLFCGAGGVAMGYHRAGFDVVGVDVRPQPNYPFRFIRADAIEYVINARVLGTSCYIPDFAAVHASPPCQAYVRSGMVAKDGRHPRLIDPVRDVLQATGLPWVIENVPGSPLRSDLILCGSMFGLAVRRHRWFECGFPIPPFTLSCDHSRAITGVYGNPHGKRGAASGMLPSDIETWSRAMGIDWMTAKEIALAIPPAYTEFIGRQLLAHVQNGKPHDLF